MKALLLVVPITLGFIAFGIVVGLSACASVQGLDVCLDYFTRSILALL